MNDERTSGIKQEGEGRMGNKRNAAGGFGGERERAGLLLWVFTLLSVCMHA
jgi:hypothetical protein